MCKIKVQPPVIEHIPSYPRYGMPRQYLVAKLAEVGIEPMLECPDDDPFILSPWWYHTTLDGWGNLLPNLILASNLYKQDIFMCWGYALNAQVECARRYSLNTLLMCIGKIEGSPMKHAFNIFPYGNQYEIEGFMLFEPNGGYEVSGQGFPLGEAGYLAQYVLLARGEN